MEIVIIAILIFTILVTMIGLNIRPQEIKKLKETNDDKEKLKLIKKFPSNKQICKEILKMLENENVTIEETQNQKNQTSLYLVMSNKILIANIDDSFTRIQTIAHECIHSVQNKSILKFNFILSNINILYFIIICILAICKLTNKETEIILLLILILMQFIFYAVRSFLETDAMTRAEYVTKEYIENKHAILPEEANKILNEYKNINKIGIKLYNFILIAKSLLKPITFIAILICTNII